jgi:2-polyprenyl-3-methyl-5-hydroxy-6-metoxy-1,4-benzoquinol methylase
MDKIVENFGLHALERMAEAPRFNTWTYKVISPYLKGKILEIGSGIGNLSSYFIRDTKNIWLSDYDHKYIQLLKQKFPELPATNVLHLDLSDTLFKKENQHLQNTFDSIFLLNVLEHIEDDHRAVEYCRFLLKPGGSLLILVPAYPFLFSQMDKLLAHYRRYTVSTLKAVIAKNNLITEKAFYFNLLGILGWWWNKIFKIAEISQTKMNLYNTLVPLAKVLDKTFSKKFGLSVIVVARKT